jgi:glycosyltransferase involved in cell wall biosynthesis
MSGPVAVSPVDVSVVVLSYDRVHLLKRTLDALLDPAVARGVSFEVIVADNHAERLAEGYMRDYAAAASFPVTYLADGARNYSIVRNLGVKAARGRYIAFVDDDEEPQPGWLYELYACLERTGGDAAFGRKLPLFESGGPPDWDPTAQFFKADREQPQDVATCFEGPEPFAVRFGIGGGEDTYLLFKLALEGKRFFWCPAAVVVEFMEADRVRPSYIITRLMKGSQHYASRRVALATNKTAMGIRVSLLGLAQLAVETVLWLVTLPFSKPAAFAHRVGMAKGIGKLTWRKPLGFIVDGEV